MSKNVLVIKCLHDKCAFEKVHLPLFAIRKIANDKGIKYVPSALLSYISTREFLRT